MKKLFPFVLLFTWMGALYLLKSYFQKTFLLINALSFWVFILGIIYIIIYYLYLRYRFNHRK